jgi:hypothetical protein
LNWKESDDEVEIEVFEEFGFGEKEGMEKFENGILKWKNGKRIFTEKRNERVKKSWRGNDFKSETGNNGKAIMESVKRNEKFGRRR